MSKYTDEVTRKVLQRKAQEAQAANRKFEFVSMLLAALALGLGVVVLSVGSTLDGIGLDSIYLLGLGWFLFWAGAGSA